MGIKTVTRTYNNKVPFCDFCGQESTYGGQIKNCFGCGKDVCYDCGKWLPEHPFTGEDSGDYPPRICKGCNNILTDYAVKAEQIRTKYESDIGDIERAFLKAVKS
jgi:hypothetical protein